MKHLFVFLLPVLLFAQESEVVEDGFEPIVLTDLSVNPFDTPEVLKAPEPEIVADPKEGLMDFRKLLEGYEVTGVGFGALPMVLMNGQVFAVGDKLEFFGDKGRKTPGYVLRLKDIDREKGELVVEVSSTTSVGTSVSEFRHALPETLISLF